MGVKRNPNDPRLSVSKDQTSVVFCMIHQVNIREYEPKWKRSLKNRK